MSSEAGGDPVRGIGARLRAAREKKGLALLQVAEKLHVDVRVLQALEAEDFAALGADVYVRGHLRRYAEAVGESGTELPQLYASSSRPVRPDLTRIPRGETTRPASRIMLPALLLVVACALAGLLWWLFTLPGEKAQPLPALLPAAPAAGTAAGAAAPTGALPAAAGAAEQGAPDAGAPPAASGSATEPAAATSAAPGAAVSGSAGQAQLELRFSAVSWVDVSDADGRHLLQGLMAPGSARALSGTPPLRVVLGNAPSVALELNGQAVAVTGLVHRDGSARLLIDGAGRATVAPPRLAHGG
jgi:cytoskeleton protein RodZ